MVGWAGAEPVACFDDGSCVGAPSGTSQATALAVQGREVAVGDASGSVRGWPGTHTGPVTDIAWTDQHPVSVGLDGLVVMHSNPPRQLDLGAGALTHIVRSADGQLVVLGTSAEVWFLPPVWPSTLTALAAMMDPHSAVRVGSEDQLTGSIPPPPLP